MKSWKTTSAGIVGAIALALPELQAAIDGNPDTIADWNVVAAAVLVLVGFIFARDNSVSSERAGVK